MADVAGMTGGRRWEVVCSSTDDGPFVRVETQGCGESVSVAAIDLRDIDMVIAALTAFRREHGPKSPRARFAAMLLARTLRCDDCETAVADSTWTRPKPEGRGVEWFGLCDRCVGVRERDVLRAEHRIVRTGGA